MPKQRPLKLNPDGSLHLIEADVCDQMLDFLKAHGFNVIRTPATRVRYPSGKWGWIHEPGHPDYICIKPNTLLLSAYLFYMELKAPGAATKPKHRAQQKAYAEKLTQQGFLVYLADDKNADQYEAFKLWFYEHFGA